MWGRRVRLTIPSQPPAEKLHVRASSCVLQHLRPWAIQQTSNRSFSLKSGIHSSLRSSNLLSTRQKPLKWNLKTSPCKDHRNYNSYSLSPVCAEACYSNLFLHCKKILISTSKSKPNNPISLCFDSHSTTSFSTQTCTHTQELQCVKGPPLCLWKQPERSAAVMLRCWLHVDLAIKGWSRSEIKTCATVWLGPSVPYKCTLELG